MQKLPQAILDYVVAHGECDIGQVTQAVAKYITAATASRTQDVNWQADLRRNVKRRPRSNAAKVRAGKRIHVGNILKRLVRDGHLVHVRRGVYGPPKPKLFKAKARDLSPPTKHLPPVGAW